MKTSNGFIRVGLLIILMSAAALLVNGCKDNSTDTNANTGGGGGTNPPENEVWMQNTAFNPKNKTITVGTTITWVNKDGTNHTVTSGTPGNPDGLFDSGTIGPGGTYSRTFNTTGTFNYYCRIHQDIMTGSITVQ